MGVVVASAMLVTSPVRVEAQLATQPFSAYGTGTAVQLNALGLGATQVGGVGIAFSGGSANSGGLGGTLNNQFGQAVQPPQPGKNAYGRGTGLEVGLLTATPQAVDVNQIKLSGLAEASAPPPSALDDKVINVNLGTVLSAAVARGQAQATYDANFCPVGRPLTYGAGYVTDLTVLGAPGQGTLGAPGVTQSRTVTYLTPNGDGTFGVASETQSLIAPITLLGGAVTVEIAGPIGMRALATGKPGGASVVYTGTPLLTIRGPLGVQLLQLTAEQLFGPGGLQIPAGALLNVSVGGPPKDLAGTQGSVATIDPNGTFAAGSTDIVRLGLLTLPGLSVLDLGLGHMEAQVSVPPGGVRCTLPVSKVANPDPVQVGQEVVFTINIPSDPGLFNALFSCDLVNIRAVDTIEVASGTVNFSILAADHGGVVNPANVVTWENLGSYHIGDPPLQLNLRVRINSASGTAVVRDIVDVSANLANCTGRAAGDDLVLGSGLIEGNAITGRFVLNGPTISGDLLAATGGTSAPLVLGGALVLGGLGLVRLRRTLVQRRV